MTKDEFIAFAKKLEEHPEIPGNAPVKFRVRYWNEHESDYPFTMPMEEWGTDSKSLCCPYTDPEEYYLDWWKCFPMKGGSFFEIPPGVSRKDTDIDPDTKGVLKYVLAGSWKKYAKHSFKAKADMENYKKTYVFKKSEPADTESPASTV